jgi:hypothetical protein
MELYIYISICCLPDSDLPPGALSIDEFDVLLSLSLSLSLSIYIYIHLLLLRLAEEIVLLCCRRLLIIQWRGASSALAILVHLIFPSSEGTLLSLKPVPILAIYVASFIYLFFILS